MGLMKEHVYVVAKISMYAVKHVKPKNPNFKEIVMIKKVYYTEEEAKAEVDRLNDLNAGGATESYYFWQKAVVGK